MRVKSVLAKMHEKMQRNKNRPRGYGTGCTLLENAGRIFS